MLARVEEMPKGKNARLVQFTAPEVRRSDKMMKNGV
jgi:hypothetical protein